MSPRISTDSVDFTRFGKPDDKMPPLGQVGRDRRWWTLPPDEAAQSIGQVMSVLRANQWGRQRQYAISAALWSNKDAQRWGGGYDQSRRMLGIRNAKTGEQIGFNVCFSAGSSIANRIAKNKPRVIIAPSGGDFRQHRRARKMTKFLDGVFYENKAHRKAVRAFIDAYVWGDGIIHPCIEHGRLRFKRVIAPELWVDEVEALDGDPRQIHWERITDKSVLLAAFPENEQQIRDAGLPPGMAVVGNVANPVLVRESWHLPSGPGEKDGRHVLSLDTCALSDAPWRHDWFPFCRLPWDQSLEGYWSQSGIEQIQGIQMEIRKIAWNIQRSIHLLGNPKTWLQNGAKIATQTLNNEIGGIIRGEVKPEVLTYQIVPPEVYKYLEGKKDEAFAQIGASQLSASGVKPAGLDSGEAQRVYNNIESDRFMLKGQAFEEFYLDLAEVTLATIRDHVGEDEDEPSEEQHAVNADPDEGDEEDVDEAPRKRAGDYSVTVPGAGGTTTYSWGDVRLSEGAYVLQMFSVSSLPTEPAARQATIDDWEAKGKITKSQARSLADMPDLESFEGLSNAAEQYVEMILDRMVDDGEYTAPDENDDLVMARERALEMYQRGKAQGMEEDRIELLRRFMAQIDAMTKAAQQKAMMEQAQMAAMTAPPQQGPATQSGGPQAPAPMPPAAPELSQPNAAAPATVQ